MQEDDVHYNSDLIRFSGFLNQRTDGSISQGNGLFKANHVRVIKIIKCNPDITGINSDEVLVLDKIGY